MEVLRKWGLEWMGIFKTSALISNLVFVATLLSLEKMLEFEFVCPCDAAWNRVSASAVFVFPPVLIFLLMCSFRFKLHSFNSLRSFWEVFPFIFVPPVTWLIIVFIDGQYFACAMTFWSGEYRITNPFPLLKWCKADYQPGINLNELANTRLWYAQSQFIGFCLAFVLGVIYSIGQSCIAWNFCTQPDTSGEEDQAERSRTIYNPSTPAWHQVPQGSQNLAVPNATTRLLYQQPQTGRRDFSSSRFWLLRASHGGGSFHRGRLWTPSSLN
ncbi:uncharacterized protein LOC108230008 [Kryptolebias marmoratus]|uniref:uncharacterized protein LOC108230008 n=1 Tax=Kryptolebias marmoratus TaxID=37003 RepID=UPI0007F8E617|nr:uncharacterized protein LOC108230008 [Kryptolebias marmoratus]